MSKLIAIVFAAFVGALGTSPALAAAPATVDTRLPTPENCAEADTAPPDCPVDDGVYPLPGGTGGTVPETTTDPGTPQPTAALPRTGSGGTNDILTVSAVLLTGGLIAAVAARRRTPATPDAPAA